MSEVGVVDIGTGNLFSVLRGIERAGGRPVLVRDPAEIKASRRLLLPGVGSFGDAMRRIESLGLRDVLREVGARGTPLLGICLGMQLLFDEGVEDGPVRGLGLIPGRIEKLHGGPGIIVPHVGWQRLEVLKANPLVDGGAGGSAPHPPPFGHLPLQSEKSLALEREDAVPAPWFYFSHSYVARTSDDVVIASVPHGERVPAIVRRGNVFGLQPHPEKSGRAGEALLARFLALEPA